ncbi:MAG: hypothetical protein L6R42_009530, partial [Xanthoria sp. 1 TBL-2021]
FFITKNFIYKFYGHPPYDPFWFSSDEYDIKEVQRFKTNHHALAKHCSQLLNRTKIPPTPDMMSMTASATNWCQEVENLRRKMAPYLREMDGIAEKACEFLAGVEKSDNDDETTIDEKESSVVEDKIPSRTH